MGNQSTKLQKVPDSFLGRFSDAINALRRDGLYDDYVDAICAVGEYYENLTVSDTRILKTAIALYESGLTRKQVDRASRMLMFDPDFEKKVHFGGELTAADFRRMADKLPKPHKVYSTAQKSEIQSRFRRILNEECWHVVGSAHNEKQWKYIERDGRNESTED